MDKWIKFRAFCSRVYAILMTEIGPGDIFGGDDILSFKSPRRSDDDLFDISSDHYPMHRHDDGS